MCVLVCENMLLAVQEPVESRRESASLELGFHVVVSSPTWCWELTSCPPREQYMLLTVDSFLQPLNILLINVFECLPRDLKGSPLLQQPQKTSRNLQHKSAFSEMLSLASPMCMFWRCQGSCCVLLHGCLCAFLLFLVGL